MLATATCHAEATPPVRPEVESVGAVADLPRSAVVVRPPESVLALRRAAFVERDEVVVARADEALGAAEAEERAALEWIAAAHDPDSTRARARWLRIVEDGGLLSRWARVEAARRAVDSDPAFARSLLAPVRDLEDWVGAAEARAIDALAWAATAASEDEADLERALRAALAEPVGAANESALRRALADHLSRRQELASRREAAFLYQDLLAAAPASRASAGAAEALARLINTFPDEERAALRAPDRVREIARANALESRHEYRAAAEIHEARAARAPERSLERCAALLDAARALQRGRLHTAALAAFESMIAECTPARTSPETEADRAARLDALAWAHYGAGRAALASGQPARAIEHLETVAASVPAHRLTDDALVLAARIRLERGERAIAREQLARAVDVGGDMRGEARFHLAWDLRAANEHARALEVLEASLAEGTGETAEGLVGRAAYWCARTLEDLGRRDESVAAFEALVRTRPLTYYGALALSRLTRLDAARANRLRSDLLERRRSVEIGDILAADSVRTVLGRIDERAHGQTLARGLALASVGERVRAERELGTLGLRADADDETVVALIALLGVYGHEPRAVDLARRRLAAGLGALAADAGALVLYRIAYPRAYAELFAGVAEAEQLDPSFLLAVAREESSFEPEAVSVARAYGLMQIIQPTAQRYGRILGLPSSPASLRNPSTNVRIGARYIASLLRRYEDQFALVPPAYNAGEGSVDRWIRARPEQSFDAWVEEIPYAETRGYTRRVLQSWVAYSFLDRGVLPELPIGLPARGSRTDAPGR